MELNFDFLDEIDKQDITDMYDEDTLNQIDTDNVMRIYEYLLEQGIEYPKDILIERLELFLQDSNEFIKKFEELKKAIGIDYAEKISENTEYLDKMY